MGWAAGTDIMFGLIEIALETIPDDDQRMIFYEKAIKLLQENDWDCVQEPLGEDDVYDEVVEELYPGDEDRCDDDYDGD